MSVFIRRRRDGKYLTHLVGGHARFGEQPRRIRSEGIAQCMIRIDMGEELAAYEIVEDADLQPAAEALAWQRRTVE